MKKILSILLATVFLITSTGFTISSHKCGGKTHNQSLDFIAKDLNCGMETSGQELCEKNTVKDNCCENEFQHFKVTEEFQTSTALKKLNNRFLIAFTSSIKLFIENNTTLDKQQNYTPPLPDKDIPVLIQSFLI